MLIFAARKEMNTMNMNKKKKLQAYAVLIVVIIIAWLFFPGWETGKIFGILSGVFALLAIYEAYKA